MSKEWIAFNMNHYVKVKLTPRGRDIHLDNYLKAYAGYSPRPAPYHPPKEDSEGFSEWQLWCLMQEFGEHLTMGIDPPFSMELFIQKEPA